MSKTPHTVEESEQDTLIKANSGILPATPVKTLMFPFWTWYKGGDNFQNLCFKMKIFF